MVQWSQPQRNLDAKCMWGRYVGNVESYTMFAWSNIMTVLWRMFDQTSRLHSGWNYIRLEAKSWISRFFNVGDSIGKSLDKRSVVILCVSNRNV